MKGYLAYASLFFFLSIGVGAEGSEEKPGFLSPYPHFLTAPKEGLKQLDFLGKPLVKKEKQVTLLYKNMVKRGRVQDPELVWQWGFRTGLGWNTVVKNWNVMATYSRFHSKSFASLEVGDGLILPTWKQADLKKSASLMGQSLASWRLHLDLADVEIGKNFETSKKITLRPHAGVRAAWIYQRRKGPLVEKEEGTQNKQPLFCSNNCAGIGFRSGVDSLWMISKGLSFFGDGALSLLAGYYNIDQKKRPIQRDYQTLEEEKRKANSIATAEISVGMQYEKSFLSRNFLSFRVGYELNYIFNQSRWMDWFSNAKGSMADAGSGLSLQGLTLGVRVDF